MFKYYFLGLCAGLLGALSTLLLVPDANAASIYDNTLQTADLPLVVSTANGGEPRDVTDDYMIAVVGFADQYCNDNNTWCGVKSVLDLGTDNFDIALLKYNSAIGQPSNRFEIMMYIAPKGDMSCGFYNVTYRYFGCNLTDPSKKAYILNIFDPNNSDNWGCSNLAFEPDYRFCSRANLRVSAVEFSSFNTVLTADPNDTDQHIFKSLYAISFPADVPDGYDGVEIPVVSDSFDYQPKFDYVVNKNEFTITFKDQDTDSPFKYGYNLAFLGDINGGQWKAIGDDGTYSVEDCTGYAPTHTSTITCSPGLGYYVMGVAMEDPASTFDNPIMFPSSRVIFIEFILDGVNYYSGSDEDLTSSECSTSDSGNYEIYRCNVSKHETCDLSEFSPSIVFEFIGCTIRNMFRDFKSITMSMFVPRSSVIGDSFNSMWDIVKGALGFLYAPIDFIVQFFSLIVNQQSNPTGNTCDLGAIPMFGVSAHIHICQWRYQFPQLWHYMQLFIQGGVAIGFTMAFWRRFNAIFGNHIEEDVDPYATDEDYSKYRWYDDRTGESGPIGGRKK